MINQIKTYKENKIKKYVDDYPEMVAEYQRELETIKGYNGRQILELLQNCDDQSATDVKIFLDTINNIFSIENDGIPFSLEGYRSLFIANLSSKVDKQKYIGNKGLGFRSIINWSNELQIISNNISLTYSNKLIKDFFENNFNEEDGNKIKKEFNKGDNQTPVALLAMPHIEKYGSHDYATKIQIKYKKTEEEKILDQLNVIDTDSLLFLNSIQKITIIIDSNVKEYIKKAEESIEVENIIVTSKKINDVNWKVYALEGEIDNECVENDEDKETNFQIKIAIADNFIKPNPYLFSFFPTNIKFDQEYILHATFELDSTRNQIVKSEKNKFLLKKIVEFTIQVAKLHSKNEVNYNALKILNYKHRADVLDKYGYYELIDEALENEPIFPCIDNTYKTKKEILYVDDLLSKFLLKYELIDEMPYHLIPIDSIEIEDILLKKNVDRSLLLLNDLEEYVNIISSAQLSLNDRITFIEIVLKNLKEYNKVKKEFKFNILIDENENIVNSTDNIYTIPSKDNKLIVPEFSKIKSVNNQFYRDFNNRNNKTNLKSNTRFFYDTFKDYCNIYEYDIVPLMNRIISKTNELASLSSLSITEKTEVTKEAISALYQNYQQLENKGVNRDLNKLIVLTKSNEFKPITNLFLSVNYGESGRLNQTIFQDIYTNEDYISDIYKSIDNDFQLGLQKVEEFLIWLGINKFLIYSKGKFQDSSTYGNQFNGNPYVKYVRKIVGNREDFTSYEINYFSIDSTLLKKINIYQLICFCQLDNFMSNQINDRKNSDTFEFYYRSWKEVSNNPSYIKFQINKVFNFENFIIEDKFSWVNDFELDYNHELFKKLNIGPSVVKNILIDLGAIENFEDAPLELLNASFEKFNNKFQDGKSSQSFYKQIVKILSKRDIVLDAPFKLFANNGEDLVLKQQNEVYFSDNNLLPKRFAKQFPLLNFPLRAGAKEAIKRFKINDLDDLVINIKSYKEFQNLNEEFHDFFKSLKPYILAYRLEEVETDASIQSNVQLLNAFRFEICQDLVCQLEDDIFNLEDNAYAYNKNSKTYFIKVNHESTLQKLRCNPAFIDIFSEVLTSVFSTKNEKHIFESLIKDSTATINYNLEKALGNNALEEAKVHLGQISSKKYFWTIIFKLIDNPEDATDEKIDKFKEQNFGEYVFDLDYINYNNEKNFNQFKEIFDALNIYISDFNDLVTERIDLTNYNKLKFVVEYHNFNNEIKQILYKGLQTKGIDEKRKLYKYFNLYNLAIEEIKAFANEYSEAFINNPKDIVVDFFKKEFDEFDFDTNTSHFNLNQLETEFSKAFTEDELFLIRQNTEWQSLLVFGEIDLLRLELEDNSEIVEEDEAYQSVDNNDNADTLTRTKTTVLDSKAYSTQTVTKTSIAKGLYKGQSRDQNYLKRKGNKAEDIAYQELVEKYTEQFVHYKSKENEALHYDISYSKDQGKSWVYVDVKSSSNGNFYVSASEKLFGEENKDNYEIWVYINNEFKILEKFFCVNPILNATEYVVQLKLTE
ncbi:sacsin N-terminal ATP-binding-like domain-containing protein [Paenimyroides baculatum]|uniref:DUF3883 domain-containing protein n=1 Tax=Paenimyroides baculatum TaxID=2608000 RepID=A0A5M6CKP5_9FLAO|nr:DUF3883 domain-containing protein [Paenimyroides baculatum]KAA5535613.1 DUF3883 domain-containing protein [Paenimyroides baculatum]